MKNIILKYAWAVYLSVALTVIGYGVLTWQWWVIFVPAVFLVTMIKGGK